MTRKLDAFPVFPHDSAPPFGPDWRLTVDGLVATPLSLSHRDLLGLPRDSLVSDFECVEGWMVPKNRWEGVRVATLLELALPQSDARYVTFVAGEFRTVLSLETACSAAVLLAYRRNDAELQRAHGHPLRLVVEEGQCYQSLKWVHALHVTAEKGEETARRIALGRISPLSQ